MTGNLSNLSNINQVIKFIFYYQNNEIGEEPIEKEIDVKRIYQETLLDYERRCLMYPYFLRDDEEPLAVSYYANFNAIKIFVPKGVIKIVPINRDDEILNDYEGVFYEPSSPESMREFSSDKYVILLESSLGEDLSTFFKELHEMAELDAHIDDFNVIPSNYGSSELMSIFLIKDALSNQLINKFDHSVITNDSSIFFDGEFTLSGIGNFSELYLLEKGYKELGYTLIDDCSLLYMGAALTSNIRATISPSPSKIYVKWKNEGDPEDDPIFGTWGNFQWK